jgi:hypothetical protein
MFFPSAGQTCQSYCTYCFRWPQFVGNASFRFQAKQSDELTQQPKSRMCSLPAAAGSNEFPHSEAVL